MTTGGTMKVDATCCDAEVRYPTDYNLLEDGSELIDRLLDKFCARHKAEKPLGPTAWKHARPSSR